MRYRVKGASRSDGTPKNFEVIAQNEDDAVKKVNERGLLVESISVDERPNYSIVPFDVTIQQGQSPEMLARSLEDTINKMAQRGWEYVSIETVDALVLADRMFGMRVAQEDAAFPLHLIVFRRAAEVVQE